MNAEREARDPTPHFSNMYFVGTPTTQETTEEKPTPEEASPETRGQRRRRASEVRSVQIPPAAMEIALELADGDPHRLQINPDDGSVTILNNPRPRQG